MWVNEFKKGAYGRMLGLLYLLISLYVGWNINQLFLREALKKWMVTLPAAFVTGALTIAWITYFLAYIFRNKSSPMMIANCIIIPIFLVASVVLFLRNGKHKGFNWKEFAFDNRFELILTTVFVMATSFLMFYTFRGEGSVILVGPTVFSDFAAHTSVIRSFSRGVNFPTNYPMFPDGDMRWHFMFMFLVGNLEFLGLRLDWAVNIPSILALTGALMTLYSLSVTIFKNKAVGVLTTVLFWFRSGFAIFTFFMRPETTLLSFFTHDAFIGYTTAEAWGLWNQNVYANQRHLAFGLTLMFIIIIEILPLLDKKIEKAGTVDVVIDANAPQNAFVLFLKNTFVSKQAWVVEDWRRAVGLGLMLGASSYWNGASVIATLLVLAFIGLLSYNKLEFVILAGITIVLTLLQQQFFVPSGTSLVEPAILIGFIAPDRSFTGIMRYIIELFGIFPLMALVGLAFAKGVIRRWLWVAFWMPFFFAFTVSLTPDVMVNHKYVMMSVMLLNIFIAHAVWWMWQKDVLKIVAVLTVVFLTITGVQDMFTYVNMNRGSMRIDNNNPMTVWIQENVEPRDIILTPLYALHPIVQGGRAMFKGWPYFSWSAGYDTDGRIQIWEEMFSTTDIEWLRQALEENNISYVVIDEAFRQNMGAYFDLNEELFANNFDVAFEWYGYTFYKVR